MQAIFPAIEGTDTFIFVLSPDSVTSEICGKELAHAVSHNKRMIPIMARDVDAKAVPEPLAKLNWVFARDADSFEAAADFLISALDTDLGWVRAHTRLLTRAIEWEAKAKSNSFVLRGEDLRAAEQWLAQAGAEKERQPTPLQTTYIIASRKAAAKRQRILWGSVSLGLIIASAFAIAAYFQRQAAEQQRNIAAARQLSTEAGLTRDRRPNALQTSVLLAAQSLRRFPSMEADQVLRRSLWLLAVPVTRFTRENPARNAQFPVAEFSSDARLVALVLADFSVELREVATHRVIATLPHKDMVNGLSALRFSADGKFLATGDFTTAFVWETGKGQAVGPPIPPGAPIKALAFSADNRLLVTGMKDQTVRISPLPDSSGTQSQTLNVNTSTMPSLSGSVDAVAISPDGKYVLTSWRMDVTIWDVATGRQIGPAGLPDTHSTHNTHPDTLVFSPDGTTFASAGTRDDAVCLFETGTGRELFVLPQFAKVTRVAFSPSGKYFATVSNDLAARVWEATGAHRLIATVVHEAPITALAFSPDEQSLATASGDNTARVWDIGSSRETLRMIHHQPVRAIAFTPDGASVATAGEDGMVALWKSRTGPELAHHVEDDSPSAVRFSPDGQTVATMINDQGVIWEAMTGNAIALSATDKAPRFALTEDLRLAASASGETAEVWDVPSRKRIATLDHKPIDWAAVLDRPEVRTNRAVRPEMEKLRDRGSVEVVAFSPDGHLLLTRRLDDEGRIWDVTTGAEKWRFQNFTPRKLASFSRDGRLLAIAAGDAVRIFDAQSGKEQAAISKALGSTEAETGLLAGDADHLVFSAGNRLAVVGHRSLLIWTEEGRGIVDRKFEHHVTAFASSPDSQLIATAHAGGAVEIWSAEDGSRIDTIPPHGEIQSLAFSPDGTLLATGGDDFFARVREPRKHQEIAAFKHLDAVLCVAFSADGKLLATGSQDQTARVWDIRANDATAVINHPPRLSREGPRICAVALSPDSRYLVSGEQGGMVCVWPLQPADLIKQAAVRITRPLADEERKALEAAQ